MRHFEAHHTPFHAARIRRPSARTRNRRADDSVATFYGEAERYVRNDSTVQWRGIFYEVPPYLRRQKVRLRYALLDATRVSVLDGGAEIPVRRVQPVENSSRSRAAVARPIGDDSVKTGLNAAELILARAAGLDRKGGGNE